MKKLLVYLQPYRLQAILAPCFKLLEAAFDLIVPLVVAKIINTGIAHKQAGVGQIGAGTVRAPLGCFEKALEAYCASLGIE